MVLAVVYSKGVLAAGYSKAAVLLLVVVLFIHSLRCSNCFVEGLCLIIVLLWSTKCHF